MKKSRFTESQIVNELGTNMTERLRRDFECVGLDYNAFYPGETRLEALENLLNVPEQPDEYQVFFYHSDHLGSSSFITDINGDATQHLQYLPFGEDFVHQQNTAAYYTPYTFSGKERDLETNLSYFGARYYESSLSIWLSVDPLSDKYPSLSAYNYCALNPVMLVDPDGRDIWEIDENGKIVNRIEDKTKDEFHKVDSDGKRIEGECQTFDYGTVKSQYEKDIKVRNSEGEAEVKTMTIFEINGDENATKLFEFLAGSETVEWTHAKIGTNKSGRNIVGTSNDQSSTPVGHYLRETGYTLREVNHNHPGRTLPSPADIKNAALYEAKGRNIKLNVLSVDMDICHTTALVLIKLGESLNKCYAE